MAIGWVVFIGILGGAAVGFQSPMSGIISQRVGPMGASLIIHLGGLLITMAALLFGGAERLREWRSLPWYLLLAGGAGVLLFATIHVTLPRLGGAVMIALIIIGELLIGIVIDHFGWFGVAVRPIDLTRVLGVIVLLAGGYLVAR